MSNGQNNGGRVAFPSSVDASQFGVEGLTKRELFAAMAMQGICGCADASTPEYVAPAAVAYADALLAALEAK